MENNLSDGFKNQILFSNINLVSPRGVMSLVMKIDLLVIIPSVLIFLAFNMRALYNHGILITIVASGFLLYLPLSILSGGIFFSRKHDSSNRKESHERKISLFLFFIFLFSVLGIYIPTVGELAQLIPTFGSLNLIGGVLVLVNCFLVWKVLSRMIND